MQKEISATSKMFYFMVTPVLTGNIKSICLYEGMFLCCGFFRKSRHDAPENWHICLLSAAYFPLILAYEAYDMPFEISFIIFFLLVWFCNFESKKVEIHLKIYFGISITQFK